MFTSCFLFITYIFINILSDENTLWEVCVNNRNDLLRLVSSFAVMLSMFVMHPLVFYRWAEAGDQDASYCCLQEEVEGGEGRYNQRGGKQQERFSPTYYHLSSL